MIVQVTLQFGTPYPHNCDKPLILWQSYKIVTKQKKVAYSLSPCLGGKKKEMHGCLLGTLEYVTYVKKLKKCEFQNTSSMIMFFLKPSNILEERRLQ